MYTGSQISGAQSLPRYWPHTTCDIGGRTCGIGRMQQYVMRLPKLSLSSPCACSVRHAKLRQFDDEPNFQIGESFGLQNVETFEFQFGESFGLQIVESFGLKNIKSFPARKLARVSSSTLILKVGNLCTGIGMGKCMLIAK